MARVFGAVVLLALATGACGSSARATGDASPWRVTVEQGLTTSAEVDRCDEYSVPDELWQVPIAAPWTGLYVTAPSVDALGREFREVRLPGDSVALVTVDCDQSPIGQTRLTKGEFFHLVTLECDRR